MRLDRWYACKQIHILDEAVHSLDEAILCNMDNTSDWLLRYTFWMTSVVHSLEFDERSRDIMT